MCPDLGQEAGVQAIQAIKAVTRVEPVPSPSVQSNTTAQPNDRAAQPSDASGPSGRVLVAVHAVEPAATRRPGARAVAAFLAHLIAVDRRLPQMRARRRAEPADAIAVYSATLAGSGEPVGERLHRSA